jgi:hypothetical protein
MILQSPSQGIQSLDEWSALINLWSIDNYMPPPVVLCTVLSTGFSLDWGWLRIFWEDFSFLTWRTYEYRSVSDQQCMICRCVVCVDISPNRKARVPLKRTPNPDGAPGMINPLQSWFWRAQLISDKNENITSSFAMAALLCPLMVALQRLLLFSNGIAPFDTIFLATYFPHPCLQEAFAMQFCCKHVLAMI